MMIKENRARVVKDIHVNGVSNVHGVSFDGQHVWFAHGELGEVIAVRPDTGERAKSLRVPADAGVAFDGECLWIGCEDKIRRVDRDTGEVKAELVSPAGTDTSGIAYHAGHLWVGSYRSKLIYKVHVATGTVVKKLSSDRLVTGVTFRGDDLWHGSVEGGAKDSELRRLHSETGDVIERQELVGTFVSGTEADREGRVWCGDPNDGHLRLIELAN